MWLVSFAEGTRGTPEKIRASAEWALAQGIEATRHVQIPRTKGFRSDHRRPRRPPPGRL